MTTSLGTFTLHFLSETVTELESQGLTPLDLLSWPMLLQLEANTQAFAGDLNAYDQLRSEVEASVRRKAKMLDGRTGTDFYQRTADAILGAEVPRGTEETA